jgi:hypothetical protein
MGARGEERTPDHRNKRVSEARDGPGGNVDVDALGARALILMAINSLDTDPNSLAA